MKSVMGMMDLVIPDPQFLEVKNAYVGSYGGRVRVWVNNVLIDNSCSCRCPLKLNT